MFRLSSSLIKIDDPLSRARDPRRATASRRSIDRSIVIDLPRGVSHWINAEFLAAVIKAVLIAERAWVPQLIGIIVGGILCTESMHRGFNLNTESGRLKERKRKRKRETSGTRERVARGGGGYRFPEAVHRNSRRLCSLPFFCFSSPVLRPCFNNPRPP